MPEDKPQITFDEFAKVDLRVATIRQAELHPNADRLLKLQIDDGTTDGRQICAGIREHYQPENLVGKQVIIVANLAPRNIRGEESKGMLLAAADIPKDQDDTNTERAVVVLTPMGPMPPGSIVS